MSCQPTQRLVLRWTIVYHDALEGQEFETGIREHCEHMAREAFYALRDRGIGPSYYTTMDAKPCVETLDERDAEPTHYCVTCGMSQDIWPIDARPT